MLCKNYPEHDINAVFDIFEETISKGGVSEDACYELSFLNKLFASLPPEASEYAMQMLHGSTGSDFPAKAREIMPLYIRFLNLAEYLEKVDSLREIPSDLTPDKIMERKNVIDSLAEHEKSFCCELLGYKYNRDLGQTEEAGKNTEESPDEGSDKLHLMNQAGVVFACTDALKTALFYETKLGFKATHLDDEKMPHIRLKRDNIVIILMQSPVRIKPATLYELIIYASEPMLLYHELKSSGVTITEELPEAEASQKAPSNRQFVFEDPDGRRICVSQSTEIM